jgi:type I restriction enzyme S subunit
MSNSTTPIKTEKQLVPELRFKEFGYDYKNFRLSDLMTRYSEKNSDEEFKLEEILSLSVKHGIVNRKDLIGDQYKNVNHKAYIKTRLNDFVFGKSISASYPFGVFKANIHGDGLLSTLYYTFRMNNNIDPKYFDTYFSYQNRANNFLRKFVLVGDRYITTNPKFLLTGKVFVPTEITEQQKIVTFLSAVDKKIQQLTKKKELLEQYKKGVMQELFSGQLRFKDENGNPYPNWGKKRIDEILKPFSDPVNVENETMYQQIGIRSHGKGIFHKVFVSGKSLGNKRVFWIKENLFIVNIVFAWEKAVSMTTKSELGMIASHRFPMYQSKNNLAHIPFITKYFLTPKGKYLLQLASPGGAGRNKTLGKQNFNELEIKIPSLKEQQKIATYLSRIDTKIESVNNQVTQTQTFKKGLLQQMFV